MRSRTSRGVPEWSGGKELYIGSPVLAIEKVSGSPVLYRDHRKGPGGPPGGATHPRGPHGLKWEGNQPLVGWCAPHGPPPAPRVGNPRGGGRPTCLGGKPTPWPPRPPPLEVASPRGGAPPRHPIYSGGREGSRTQAPGLSLSLPCHSSVSLRLAKPCRDHRCFHHHAVVLLDLHQPLLPPWWIKLEETYSQPYVC